MKVLHVVEATTAGVGRHVRDLCRHMRLAGLEVGVACPLARQGAVQDVSFVERVEEVGVTVHVVPMRRSISVRADLQACMALGRLIDRENPDVVHTHSSKAGVLGRYAARRAENRAAVYTPNAFAFAGARHAGSRWLLEGVERWLGWHMTHALICVSRSELALARARKIAPPERLALVENCLDVDHAAAQVDSAEAKARLGLAAGRPVVGFVGRLTRQKGLGTLIRAAALLRDSAVDAQFLLVGEGEMALTLRRMVADNGLQDCFHFAGHRNNVGDSLAAMDIFTLPSLYEGLSYSLLEAMAAGRAVVATLVSGNVDLIQDSQTGLLVPPEDPAALARALRLLLSAPQERELLGRRAAAVARSWPTADQMTDRVVAVYENVLKGTSAQAHARTKA